MISEVDHDHKEALRGSQSDHLRSTSALNCTVLYTVTYLGVWIVKDSLMSEQVEEVNPVLVEGQDVLATVQGLALSSHLHHSHQSINH